MNGYVPFFLSLCGVLMALGGGGCGSRSAPVDSPQAQVVAVSLPIMREVRDYVDFTGRTEAPETVDIRARVTGYLDKISFREGMDVKKGDLLVSIDPRPFKAQYDAAVAQLDVRQAALKDRLAEYNRAKSLLPDNAISGSDYDKAVAGYGEALASVAAGRADVEAAKLNLDFTQIASPIAGRISRAYVTMGNLVKPDETLLTTVVSQDPMYVYFDVDERTMLGVIRMVMPGKEDALQAKKVQVLMGVADEDGFPHTGFADFADNVVDSSTGTVAVRGVFSNLAGPSGVRLLRPGMFVRVRLPLGHPHKAVLVAERALGTDQGKKFLLTVDAQHTVQYRRVEVGPLQEDGLRVITAGLRPDERVIVSGLQLVRPKMSVQTEQVPMLTPPADQAAPKPPGDAAGSPGPKRS
jgi:membrane fusion protein, multidrug efflux system